MRSPFRKYPDATCPPRLLASALLLLLAGGCGTGSSPAGDTGTLPDAGTPLAEHGGSAEPDTMRAPAVEPDVGEAVAIGTGADVDTNTGDGPDTGTKEETEGTGGASTPMPAPVDLSATPLACDASTEALQARLLQLVNAARAEGRDCGSAGVFAPTGPLGWDSRLEAASRAHSADMAATGNFDHTGTDGSSAGQRIERAGYAWGEYAENIAAGQTTLESAVSGWLDSPGHCRNLMAPGVSDTALACVSNDDARYRRYWTQVFARPFETRTRP